MSFDLYKILRPNIASLVPYSSARDEYSGTGAILLDANESPFNEPYNRYPDPLQRQLKEKISGIFKIPAGNIFLGNGSDEAIDLLIRAFCVPGKSEIISIDPSYGMYEVCARINDVRVNKVSLRPDFSLDASAVLDAVTVQSRIVFLCSPNNPSGNLLDPGEMLHIASEFEGLVVADEAYIDFSGSRGVLDRLADFPNLVVLRTFSKAWGLAGIRLGMAFASPEIIRILNKIKYPYNLNRLTQDLALTVIHDEAKKDAWVSEILDQRSLLETELDKLPFMVKRYPSDANFILARFTDPLGLFNYLKEKKLVVRDRSRVTLCTGCLRITVGSPAENRKLIEQLRKFR
jgi:histidinol-phosphate aminotransferase